MNKHVKKIIKFVIAIIITPIYLPILILSGIATFLLEICSGEPDLDFWKEFYFSHCVSWYLFK